MKNVFFFSFFLFAIDNLAVAQNSLELPMVGKPMPDFSLSDVTHYSDRNLSLSDFKGKWLFLDFWFVGCTSCVKSFSKINLLQRKFKTQIQYVLVGKNDKRYNKGIKELFEKLRVKQGLDIISAYDTVLVNRWGIVSMPHIYIVDPNGIVRAITDGRDVTEQKIQDLVDGKNVSFFEKDADRPLFDSNNKLRLNNDKVIYQSLLTAWNGETQIMWKDLKIPVEHVKLSQMASIDISMVPLIWLYNWAYLGHCSWDNLRDSLYGKVYPRPIFDVLDSSLFIADYVNNFGHGTYNYSLKAPSSKISVHYVMDVLRFDLKKIFGYDVKFVTRKMPVWILKSKPNAFKKLQTKGGTANISGSGGAAGFIMTNQPMDVFLIMLMQYANSDGVPCFDETGFVGNIDITLDALMTDVDDVKRALKKNGLGLSVELREMEVMVIKDGKTAL